MERNEKESRATVTRERKLCNQIRKRAKEKKTKEYKKEQKTRKHSSRMLSSITKIRIEKYNIKREKREIGKRKRAGSSAIHKSTRARISNGGRNPDGSRIEDIR